MYRNIFGVCKDVGRGTFFQCCQLWVSAI